MEERTENLRQRAALWTTTSLTVLFGMQLLRILFASLVGYLRDAQDVEAMSLAPIALGVFSVSFLAAIIRRLVGSSRAVLLTAGGVGLARLIEQIASAPELDLALSAVGVGLLLLYIPNALGAARTRNGSGTAEFGLAFMLGIAADTCIHIGARTLDLSWRPGFIPIAIVGLLAAGLAWALYVGRSETKISTNSDASWRHSLGLIALGPWLFLQMQVFQNVARVSALTGWETPAAGALVVLGNGLGVLSAMLVSNNDSKPVNSAARAGLLLVASLIITEPLDLAAVPILLIGQVSSIILATLLFTQIGQDANRPGLGRTAVSFGIGQILFVLIVFAYYVTYDISLGFRALVLLPISAVLVGVFVVIACSGPPTLLKGQIDYRPAVAALLMLIAPLGLALVWSKPQAIPPDSANATVRVIDYNVHNGFNTTGRLDLEALATIIEESEADVVGLQEISRGWLIWGRTDMLTWFSQRLDMPYVSGPTADAQWGNAILSRYPIVRAEAFPLPTEELLIRRGYIIAEIDIGRGTIILIDTHFAHRGSSNNAAREMQAAEIVRAWDGGATTVIVGDMNAPPEADSILTLSDAGLVNIAAEICLQPVLTSPASDPNRQIDYIWISPDLSASRCKVGQIQASDHLPVIATITLP